MPKMNIVLDPGAIAPTRAHPTDAGMDFYTPCTLIIPAHTRVSVDTGVHVQIPEGYFGMITSKSGLMKNKGITTRGTVDCGYTGTVQVVIFNHSNSTVTMNAGDKITQMIIVPMITPEINIVDSLEETSRGDGGFGSTGA